MAHKNAMKKFVLAIKIFPQHYGTAREVEHQEQQLTGKILFQQSPTVSLERPRDHFMADLG